MNGLSALLRHPIWTIATNQWGGTTLTPGPPLRPEVTSGECLMDVLGRGSAGAPDQGCWRVAGPPRSLSIRPPGATAWPGTRRWMDLDMTAESQGTAGGGAARATDDAARPMLAGVPTVTAEESVRIDALAVEAGLSLTSMVNRCGFLAAKILLDELLEDLVGKPPADTVVTILAGTGNKGAAALAMGKQLTDRHVTVNVVLARKSKDYEGDAKNALSQLERVAKKVYTGYNERAFDQADLIVDGLIGAGLQGTPKASVSLLIKGANFSMKPVIALDVPSGLDATTGVRSAVTTKAAATFAVGLPKRGMLGESNLALCGRIYLLDIGVPADLWKDHIGVDVSGVFDGKDHVRLGGGEQPE
jgi:NAD(P)H-hydrate epimerase